MGIIARSGAGEPDPDPEERDQRCMPGETKAVRQAEKTEIKSNYPLYSASKFVILQTYGYCILLF